MKFILTNHYPFPYPESASQEEQERLSGEAGGGDLVIEGVIDVQVLHTITVEFRDWGHYSLAKDRTGWKEWGNDTLTLEAPQSAEDGYHHFPAIITNNDTAWCGYILSED